MCHSNGLFGAKTNGVGQEWHRNGNTCNCVVSVYKSIVAVNANSVTFMAIITFCSVLLFSQIGWDEFDDGVLLETIILNSNDGYHWGVETAVTFVHFTKQ